MTTLIRSSIIAALVVAAGVAGAADNVTVKSTIRSADGKTVGVATLTDTPGGMLIVVDFAGLPAGEHAFHIHEVGKCEPPFTSAGGHFNPGAKKHGFAHAGGYHAGDMPNVVIPESGSGKIETFVPNVHLKTGSAKLLDQDGSALVVHAGVDDYKTDPAGNAGDRIACGVIEGLERIGVDDLKVAP